MPEVNRKAPNEEHTQSVIFEKEAGWTEASSRKWCKDHDYYTDGLDETDTRYRWRQYDPDDQKFIYRMKEIEKNSISFVLGIPKNKSKESDEMTSHYKAIRCFDGAAKPHEPFWHFVNEIESESGQVEIELNGVLSEYSWFEDDITPKMFKDELYRIGKGGPVLLRINSPGGDVIAASQMRAILTDYPGLVTARVDGIAASAAVIVTIAASRVKMMDSAIMMIHDPMVMVLMAALDIETLGKLRDDLKSIKDSIVPAYVSRTGLTEEKVSRMMTNETWMSAREAVDFGFADEIIPGGQKKPAVQNVAFINCLSNYAHVPPAVMQAISQSDNPPAADSSDPSAAEIERKAQSLRDRVTQILQKETLHA